MTTTPSSDKARDVRAMFSRIARRYDLMNSLMTFGMHGRWRRAAAREALTLPKLAGGGAPAVIPSPWRERVRVRAKPKHAASPETRTPLSGFAGEGPGVRPVALDIGTGTGDLALALAREGAARVIAADFSELMLLEAQSKLATSALIARCPLPVAPSVRLLAADAMRLPFRDETFDCITNGFVLRNVADLGATFVELLRVLRPGGRLVCLELTHPPAVIAPLFRPYFERLVPILGRIIAGDAAAYTYLPASVRPFPDAARLAAMLCDAGFVDVRYRRLTIGAVCLHIGVKP